MLYSLCIIPIYDKDNQLLRKSHDMRPKSKYPLDSFGIAVYIDIPLNMPLNSFWISIKNGISAEAVDHKSLSVVGSTDKKSVYLPMICNEAYQIIDRNGMTDSGAVRQLIRL